MPADRIPMIDLERREALVKWTLLTAAALVAGRSSQAWAFSLADLTQKDASAGVKTALEKGADVAVQLLGKEDGFWGNDKVRIPLPDWLEKGEKVLKLVGRGKDIDDLKLGVNRAAEQAVPQAKQLLKNAVKSMTVQDAKGILTGGDNSVTDFLRPRRRRRWARNFCPSSPR